MIEQIILRTLHSQLKIEEAALSSLEILGKKKDMVNLFETINIMTLMTLAKVIELKRQIREL